MTRLPVRCRGKLGAGPQSDLGPKPPSITRAPEDFNPGLKWSQREAIYFHPTSMTKTRAALTNVFTAR
jgi:hypothetical protein